MRSLPSELSSALESGTYTPYFQLSVTIPGEPDPIYFTDILYYQLRPTSLIIKFHNETDDVCNAAYFYQVKLRLTRGVTIGTTNYTITTGSFFPTTSQWDGYFQTIEASLLPDRYYATIGNRPYRDIIDEVCTQYGKTAVYKNPSAAWLDYQCYPAGKNFVAKKGSALFTILRQKYLIEACDNGNEEILYGEIAVDPTPLAYTVECRDMHISTGVILRNFLSRDENNTSHYFGTMGAPIWNLGFLPSTAETPPHFWSNPIWKLDTSIYHLKYQTLDKITFTLPSHPQSYQNNLIARVIETFDPKKHPSWSIEIQNHNWAENEIEGGALPGTLEAATPLHSAQYLPLQHRSKRRR